MKNSSWHLPSNVRQNNSRTKLGDYAERLVFNYLRKIKPTSWALDPFDQEKDLTFNGFTVEVKARTRIIKRPVPGTFAIEENQWKKLDAADIVLFVNIPMSKDEPINIYFLKNKKAYEINCFKPEESLRFYHIDKMQRIYTIDDYQTCSEFYNLNVSKYKR